jgi:hypothetical protein
MVEFLPVDDDYFRKERAYLNELPVRIQLAATLPQHTDSTPDKGPIIFDVQLTGYTLAEHAQLMKTAVERGETLDYLPPSELFKRLLPERAAAQAELRFSEKRKGFFEKLRKRFNLPPEQYGGNGLVLKYRPSEYNTKLTRIKSDRIEQWTEWEQKDAKLRAAQSVAAAAAVDAAVAASDGTAYSSTVHIRGSYSKPNSTHVQCVDQQQGHVHQGASAFLPGNTPLDAAARPHISEQAKANSSGLAAAFIAAAKGSNGRKGNKPCSVTPDSLTSANIGAVPYQLFGGSTRTDDPHWVPLKRVGGYDEEAEFTTWYVPAEPLVDAGDANGDSATASVGTAVAGDDTTAASCSAGDCASAVAAAASFGTAAAAAADSDECSSGTTADSNAATAGLSTSGDDDELSSSTGSGQHKLEKADTRPVHVISFLRSSHGSSRKGTQSKDMSHASNFGAQAAGNGALARELGITGIGTTVEVTMFMEIASAHSQRPDNRPVSQHMLDLAERLINEGFRVIILLSEIARLVRLLKDMRLVAHDLTRLGVEVYTWVSQQLVRVHDRYGWGDTLSLVHHLQLSEDTGECHSDYKNRHVATGSFLARRTEADNYEPCNDALIEYTVNTLAAAAVAHKATHLLVAGRVSPKTVKPSRGEKSAQGLVVQLQIVLDIMKLVQRRVQQQTGTSPGIVTYAALDDSGDSCPGTAHELAVNRALQEQRQLAVDENREPPRFLVAQTACDRTCRSEQLLEQTVTMNSADTLLTTLFTTRSMFDVSATGAELLARAVADAPVSVRDTKPSVELTATVHKLLLLSRNAKNVCGPFMLPVFVGETAAVADDGWARAAMKHHEGFRQTFPSNSHLSHISKYCTQDTMIATGSKGKGLTGVVKTAAGTRMLLFNAYCR